MTALLTNQEYKMCVPSEVVDDKLELFSSKIFLQIHNTKYILFFPFTGFVRRIHQLFCFSAAFCAPASPLS